LGLGFGFGVRFKGFGSCDKDYAPIQVYHPCRLTNSTNRSHLMAK